MNHANEVVEAASLAQKESALSAQEKETFSGFLKEEFFTKQDFARLDPFYAHTWDRLSDGGKDEMSHRFWEGIRRNEYQFRDAPQSAQEKETEWAYATLVKRQRSPSRVDAIPEKDRTDFIRAYESGREDEAKEILGRQSFRENMSLGLTSRVIEDLSAKKNEGAARGQFAEKLRSGPVEKSELQTSPDSSPMAELDFSSIKLDGIKAADGVAKVSPADIPRASVSAARE